jgi:hypothetical protein
MKPKIAIYLAGSIKKAHERSDESFWTDDDIALLREQLSGYEVSFQNPAFRTDDLTDSFSVFGRDMLQVFSSDFVLVDARNRRGLGVGAEMMWAKMNTIPVVVWAPRNSHYRKDQTTVLGVPLANFIHPFVESLSDQLVANLIEGADWIRSVVANPTMQIKGIQYMEAAMQHYKNSQFYNDLPMRELLTTNDKLKKYINEI